MVPITPFGGFVRGLRILLQLVSFLFVLSTQASEPPAIHNDSQYSLQQQVIENEFFGYESYNYDITSAPSIPCYDHGKLLNVMNEEALNWKATKNSGYKTRALISGTVAQVFADKSGHRHFSMKIGVEESDRIEVIYNESFGAMPQPHLGESVVACGDFIVATKRNGSYPPSPDGALIHWVHRHTGKGHDDGYVILNEVVYGQ